jgi:hypothetical protein
MTTKYEKWIKDPDAFRSMTGYSIEAFVKLLPFFESAHARYYSKHGSDGKPCKRRRLYVLNKNSPLPTMQNRLCFILYYLKHNPIQMVQADIFDMTTKQTNIFIHSFSLILEDALDVMQMLPAANNEDFHKKALEMGINEVIHDGTEREIPRPTDFEKQRETYSGKTKKNTIKNGIICTMIGFILFVSASVDGKTHDKKIADTHYSFPVGMIVWQDTGYQGYKPVGVTIYQPIKKPRGGELTGDQKAYNREISKIRVRVEHAIGGAKRFRIVKDECRAYKNDFRQRVMLICSGSSNLRITLNKPQYPDYQRV